MSIVHSTFTNKPNTNSEIYPNKMSIFNSIAGWSNITPYGSFLMGLQLIRFEHLSHYSALTWIEYRELLHFIRSNPPKKEERERESNPKTENPTNFCSTTNNCHQCCITSKWQNKNWIMICEVDSRIKTSSFFFGLSTVQWPMSIRNTVEREENAHIKSKWLCNITYCSVYFRIN